MLIFRLLYVKSSSYFTHCFKREQMEEITIKSLEHKRYRPRIQKKSLK